MWFKPKDECGEKIYLNEDSFEKAYSRSPSELLTCNSRMKGALSLFPVTQFQQAAEINEIAGQPPSGVRAMKGEEIQLRTGN